MHRFYSSLIINSRRFPLEHQVFYPRYNRHYFKRLEDNLDLLKAHVAKRCRGKVVPIPNNFVDLSRKLVNLKNKHDKAVSIDLKASDFDENRRQLQDLEETLMPFVISIPNRFSGNVPEEDVILDKIDSEFLAQQRLSKVLNFTKLSYINNCYSKSIVGPNSYYYYGIGSKLQHGLNEYFTEELEQRGFLPTSGACITKSAVVEASNSIDVKNYMNDPCRISERNSGLTTLHMVEASRESLLSFITTIGPRSTKEPLRLLASGMGYRQGSDWFDSDEKRITQFSTVHALTLNSSIESLSMGEYLHTKDIIWNLYKRLELPARLTHCGPDSMISNEYDAYKIELWLPSKQKWIQASRISHYLDYITIRTGLKRGHINDSMVYDAQVLIAAIIENKQTTTGHFIIPKVIKNHMPALSESESKNYFSEAQEIDQSNTSGSYLSARTIRNNYEQRRYFSKKSYVFGHSKKALYHEPSRSLGVWTLAVVILCFGLLIDWTEVWIQFAPRRMKRFFYDNFYRPGRRIYWRLTQYNGVERSEDLPFDQENLEHYDKTMAQRRKENYFKFSLVPEPKKK